MSGPFLLCLALVLDALAGEPSWLWSKVPHPVVVMGRFIGWLDRSLNQGSGRRVRGFFAVVILVCLVGALAAVPGFFRYGWVFEVLLGAILLAQRSLVQHVLAVADGLDRGIDPGRSAVAMIVGRDPEALDQAGVSRAAIESAAENFSDGVIAPAFWFAVAGLPGIAIYKAINTADSMIGHRNERYGEFGWAAAKLDDLVNLIPARLAGLLISIVGGGRGAARVMWQEAGQHRSPNAGWPEAAMAASLGVALAGPRAYAGEGVVDDAFINAKGRRDASAQDIRNACALLWRAWAVSLAVAAVIGLAFWL